MDAALQKYLRSIAHVREMTLQQAQLVKETLESMILTLRDGDRPEAEVLQGMKDCIVTAFLNLAEAEYSRRRRGLAFGIIERFPDRTTYQEAEHLVDSAILEATVPSSRL